MCYWWLVHQCVGWGCRGRAAAHGSSETLKVQERLDLTIIAPMYNELENVERTIERIENEMASFEGSWELVLVNDGSTDGSWERAREVAEGRGNVRVIGYGENRGRGAAIRTGFDQARGQVVATVDFDLSYSPDHVLRMYRILESEPATDMVLASCYMPGGSVVGVPLLRLLVSWMGNLTLRLAFRGRFRTTTCIVRAYRRKVLDALVLESERKEIHLEILSKALALGFSVVEMPATLKSRARGSSKFNFLRTSLSHLAFAAEENPLLAILALFVVAGVAAGAGVVSVAANWFAVSAADATASRGEFLIWPILKVAALLGALYAVLLLAGAFAVRFKNRRRIAVHIASRAKLAALAKARKEKNRED